MPDPTVIIEPVAVRRETAARMLDCGPTKVYDLCRRGELRTIKVGADTRVVVASIREFVIRGGTAAR